MLGTAVGLLVAVVLVAVAIHVGALLITRARASTAADHAALAAATALAHGDDPVDAARQVTSALGARLVSCACAAAPVRVAVELEVPTPLGRLPDSISAVRATGHAGLVPAPG